VNATLAKLTRLTSEPPTGDGPLLDAFLAGDRAAFALLVRRHAGLVFATCSRILRHQQDAEDALQATFLVLARRAADVWPREAVGSWLFGVAHRIALKARAVRTRRAARVRPLTEVAATDSLPDFDLAEAVQRVVSRLPEVYRAAVVACDLQGLTRKEAAERLGWSEGTLSGRLARARELLARRFRRAGLALPAGGLAVVLAAGPEEAHAAHVQATIDLVTGVAGACASAPVAALTEGVVRSMALFKLKVMTAAIVAACAIGFGVLTAAGHGAGGSGDGRPDAQPPVKVKPPGGADKAPEPAKEPPKGPRVGLAREELDVMVQEIELAAAAGKVDKVLLERLRTRLRIIDQLLDPDGRARAPMPRAKAVTDQDRLQGEWRVLALTEDGKTTPTDPRDPWIMEFVNRTLWMPFRVADGRWKQREYVFSVNENTTPRTVTLNAPNKVVVHAIYEFTLPSAQCSTCHEHPFVEKGKKPPTDERLGACAPVLKDKTRAAALGLRLALNIDGQQPEKFGGAGVIVFELRRLADIRAELLDRQLEQARLLENQAQLLQSLAVAKTEAEKLRLALELAAVRKRLAEFAAMGAGPKPATSAVEQAKAQLVQAQRDAELALSRDAKAQANAEQARAQAAEALRQAAEAKAQVELAVKRLELAQERLKIAEKNSAGAGQAPDPHVPAGGVFTVHIRTLTAAEKVIRVKSTGKETVLEGLVHAADDVSIKSDALSVWVVRDKTVLSVDLPAILKGDTKTNHALKPGDQLFVQAKPAK
jgi:RNA polymerase sigma factor (sigma-70 family)